MTAEIDETDALLLPDGTVLQRSDLPAPGNRRWTPRRKALVVNAVCHGLMTPDEAWQAWDLSAEELSRWIEAYLLDGHAGLRIKAMRRPVRGGKPGRGRRR